MSDKNYLEMYLQRWYGAKQQLESNGYALMDFGAIFPGTKMNSYQAKICSLFPNGMAEITNLSAEPSIQSLPDNQPELETEK